jgi:hypothetical protein
MKRLMALSYYHYIIMWTGEQHTIHPTNEKKYTPLKKIGQHQLYAHHNTLHNKPDLFLSTLATQRAQFEHLTKWLCPRPFNARPAFLRFWVIFGELSCEDNQSEKDEGWLAYRQ